jgi:hypothetical protein
MLESTPSQELHLRKTIGYFGKTENQPLGASEQENI